MVVIFFDFSFIKWKHYGATFQYIFLCSLILEKKKLKILIPHSDLEVGIHIYLPGKIFQYLSYFLE